MSEHADNRPGRIGGVKLEEAHQFLDQLREEGVINIFGALPYLQDTFGLGFEDSEQVQTYWTRGLSDE